MLKSIRLKNTGSFSEFEANFSEGINVVIGPNGSGKTTLLNAIYSCIAFSDRDYRRSDLITLGSQHCRVSCDLITDKEFRLVLDIRTGQFNRNQYDYYAFCEEVKIPKRDLPKFYLDRFGSENFAPIYIRQGNLLFLFDSFSGLEEGTLRKRARTVILRLLGISNFDSFLSTLTKESKYEEIRVRRNDLVLQLDKRRQDIQSFSSSLDAIPILILQQKRSELEKQRDSLLIACKDLDRLSSLAENRRKVKEWKERLDDILRDLASISNEIFKIESDLRTLIDEVRARVKLDSYTVDSVFNFLQAQAQGHSWLNSTAKEYKSLYEDIRRLFNSRPKPCSLDLERLQKEVRKLKSFVVFLSDLKESQTCPVCGADYDPSRVSKLDETALKSEIARYEEEISKLSNSVRIRNEIAKKLASLILRGRQIKNEINERSKSLLPYFFVSEKVASIGSLRTRLTTLSQKRHALVTEAETLKNRISVVESGLCEIYDLDKIPDESVRDRLKEVKDEISKIDAALQEYQTLKTKLEEHSSIFSELQRRLADLELDVKVEEDYLRFITRFEQEIDNFCTEFFVDRLIASINGVLGEGSCPFRLDFTDQGLRARFSNGRLLPVSLLSYGQRILISLLLYLFFYLPLNRNLIFLLDEPMAHLDAETVSFLERVFNDLPRIFGHEMPQIILTTNQEGIYGSNRIDLYRIGS